MSLVNQSRIVKRVLVPIIFSVLALACNRGVKDNFSGEIDEQHYKRVEEKVYQYYSNIASRQEAIKRLNDITHKFEAKYVAIHGKISDMVVMNATSHDIIRFEDRGVLVGLNGITVFPYEAPAIELFGRKSGRVIVRVFLDEAKKALYSIRSNDDREYEAYALLRYIYDNPE